MKITFTCEKCGVQVGCPMTGVRAGSAVSLPYHDCSLAYGPLTEEMVAEALRQARGDDIGREPYGDMARFVLRLLDKAPDAVAALKDNDQSKIHWREWLSDLARPYR